MFRTKIHDNEEGVEYDSCSDGKLMSARPLKPGKHCFNFFGRDMVKIDLGPHTNKINREINVKSRVLHFDRFFGPIFFILKKVMLNELLCMLQPVTYRTGKFPLIEIQN